MKKNKIKDKIVNFVYKTTEQPIRFKDLLHANSSFNEGMYVDPGKIGFRLNITNAYIAYALIVTICLVPLFLLTHKLLENLDFHISIIGSIFATACVFVGFKFYEDWLRDEITLRQIKKAWTIHFPYFAYEKYSQKVEKIYNDAHKKEMQRKDLQQYVMEELLKEEEK